MPIHLIDTHCHFDLAPLNSLPIWQACQKQGILQLIIPGTFPSQWLEAERCAQQYAGMYFAVGIHPWYLDRVDDGFLQTIKNQVTNERCIAIGECGLDGTQSAPMANQQTVFEAHIEVALETGLPLMIHSVKAHNEVIRCLKKYPGSTGVIHGFSGSYEMAKTFWDMGFYLGVGGTITYPRAKKTRDAIKKMPMQSLLLETDAPSMPIQGKQGQPNSPVYLPEIAQCLAELKGETIAIIAEQTTANALALFKKCKVEMNIQDIQSI